MGNSSMIASLFQPDLSRPDASDAFRLLGAIDEFKGNWKKIKELRAERLAGLRQVATIESSGSSTRIEGAELSDQEVAQVLGGLSISGLRNRDASEVLGYGELLQTIFDGYQDIPLEERFIQQLHGILLRHSEADAWHRGKYKTNPNHVEARYPDGRTEIIFRTASPFETPARMESLVASTNDGLSQSIAHPLIVIARFVVDLLAIHPFQDGNGRLSRALTTLLLLRSGYEYVPYASLERVVENNKVPYYAALRGSQTAMRSEPSAFGPWLMFLLRCLRAHQADLLAKLDIERSMASLSDAQKKIIDLVDSNRSVTSTLLAERLAMPVRTVRYHLDILIQQGLLVPQGEKRGRRYTRSTGGPSDVSVRDSKTAAILAAILQGGGRISSEELAEMVGRHGYDPRVVGTLHGKRLAHLRRDGATGMSELTLRGREVAEQYMFARRLAEGARRDPV